MAWRLIAASEVDVDSPITAYLMGGIKDDLDNLKAEDATWTQNKAAAGYDLTGLDALEAASGDFDTLVVNTSMSGVGKVLSTPTITGTTTSEGTTNGTVNNTAAENFLLGIAEDTWACLVPAVKANFLFTVNSAIDADSFDIKTDDLAAAATSDTIPNATAYNLLEISKFNGKKIASGSLSISGIGTGAAEWVYDTENVTITRLKDGYLKRVLKVVISNHTPVGSARTDVSFGDTTQKVITDGNATFYLFCTADGTVTLRAGCYHGTVPGAASLDFDYDIYAELPVGS